MLFDLEAKVRKKWCSHPDKEPLIRVEQSVGTHEEGYKEVD